MTQKELLYLEDAIGHEKSIIKIINDATNNLQEDELVSFMNSELEKHKQTKERLINLLEEKQNE